MLFVTPYNKLCQDLRKENYDSVTLNKLLNIDICGNYYKYSTSYDTTSCEAICFDEILLYNPGYLNKINTFMKKKLIKKCMIWVVWISYSRSVFS